MVRHWRRRCDGYRQLWRYECLRRVEVVDDSAFAYYSQHDIDGSYWNGGALSGIYFSAGVTKRYAIDRYNGNLDWMDEGCALTAHAICLRNLGATMTEGYDFRSGQTGNLPADPIPSHLPIRATMVLLRPMLRFMATRFMSIII